ncbi:MAG: NapC/NirT family cytochrome c [Proteobacteria bacterium]|nr:NapC/NirT family cytochrome c [Pseudomonadota bacterium]
MKKYYKQIMILCFGGVLGMSFLMMSNIAMLMTSTPEFCSSCHEIQPAYNEWKTSSHANNDKGVVAVCMDCHLPRPEDTVRFFYTKTLHGLKDVVGHMVGGEYDRLENRKAAYGSIDNSYCMKCHKNLLYISDKRGAMLAHRTVLYPMKGYEKKCTDCHQNLVHKPAASFSMK